MDQAEYLFEHIRDWCSAYIMWKICHSLVSDDTVNTKQYQSRSKNIDFYISLEVKILSSFQISSNNLPLS